MRQVVERPLRGRRFEVDLSVADTYLTEASN
jgi:hypothetical protein